MAKATKKVIKVPTAICISTKDNVNLYVKVTAGSKNEYQGHYNVDIAEGEVDSATPSGVVLDICSQGMSMIFASSDQEFENTVVALRALREEFKKIK